MAAGGAKASELRRSLQEAQNLISYAFTYETNMDLGAAYDHYVEAARHLEPVATFASNDEEEYAVVQEAYQLYNGLVPKVAELSEKLGIDKSAPATTSGGEADLEVEDKGGDMAAYNNYNGPSYSRPTASSNAKYGSNPYNPPKTYSGQSSYGSRYSSSAASRRTSYNPSASIEADKKKKKAEDKEAAMLKKCVESEHCKGINEENIKRIINECCEAGNKIRFSDITGLDFVKQTLNELIILPARKPELFTGLRAPTKGILLFGPPGNGKTMIGRAISVESGMNFMSISASSLTSKWVGEAETNVRAMFAVARAIQPTVLFIDEIDSILTSRGSNEQESSRRLKTEMLVQMDGIRSSNEDRLLVIAATNRPEELDDAVLRRLPKRVYVPLPEQAIREELIRSNLKKVKSNITPAEITRIGRMLDGYSCSDITQLIKEAVMEPVRDIVKSGNFNYIQSEGDIRAVEAKDFTYAMKIIRPSLEASSLHELEEWARKHGVSGI